MDYYRFSSPKHIIIVLIITGVVIVVCMHKEVFQGARELICCSVLSRRWRASNDRGSIHVVS